MGIGFGEEKIIEQNSHVNVEHEIKIFEKSANLQESDRFSLIPPQGRKQHESPSFCYFIIKNQKSKAKQEIKKSPNQGGQVNREDILVARTPSSNIYT
jgi:hypothetical protein